MAGREVNCVIGFPMITVIVAKNPTGWSVTITIGLW